jgi:retron-type reverse transcriptase
MSIYKKDDGKDVQNYRGLSINSVFSRLYTKVIKNKLEREVKDLIDEHQSGFRAGRSCVDNLFVLQQLIEKQTFVGKETHLASIDIEKAYDSVPRCRLGNSN